MNVGQAKTALKAYGFDDTDPLLTWLEAAKSNFESGDNWPFLRKTVLIPVLAGDISLSGVELPADFVKVASVRDNTDQRKLVFMDPQAYDRDIEDPLAPGVPTYYTVNAVAAAPGYEIVIWPASPVAWTMQLRYEATLSDITALADGTAMPGPAIIHFPIVQGAAVIALQVDNEEDRAATAQAASNESMGHLRRRFFSNLDGSRTVQNTQRY